MAVDKVKNSIVNKSLLLYGLMLVASVVIIVRVVLLKTGDQEYLIKAAAAIKDEDVEGARGDILSSDGRILASSMPTYELRWDLRSHMLSDNDFFEKNVDTLAKRMSELFKDSTAESYARMFREAYKNKKGYYLIKKQVSRAELSKIRKFPIFEKGRYKSGLIVYPRYSRSIPHGELARRSIGYLNEQGAQVGLEDAFNDRLSGVKGKQRMTKIGGGEYYPLDSYDGNIDPEDGCDIISTINVEIQDIAEKSLQETMQQNQAKFGVAIVMEVKTGKIRAIANLGLEEKSGTYKELFNYAIGRRLPPGSTYKLASLIAILDKTNMDIDDLVDIKSDSYLPKGRTKPIKDDHDITPGQYTIREIFEKSSNVGVATLVRNTYPDIKDEQEFTTRLGKMNLDKVTGVDLHGEVEPVFRHAVQDNMWSRGSLEMVAIGYETEYTPLQILTFYNAVANDGKMMKPQILEAVRSHGVVVETIAPEVLNSSICNSATIKKVHELLKGVVQNGTANRIKSPYYEIAGKTGTAQIYENDKLVGHSASFAGFFPADHPKYSCIVVVTSPKNGNVYGSSLAAPVFKKIADKLYASDRDLHAGKNFDIASLPDNKKVLPTFKDGDRSILDRLFSEFNVTVGNLDNSQSLFVTTTNENGVVMLEPVSTRKAVVPNVVGMGLRDAMYLLRMKHLKVTVVGRGVVKKQSIPANTDIKGGEKITIELAIN